MKRIIIYLMLVFVTVCLPQTAFAQAIGGEIKRPQTPAKQNSSQNKPAPKPKSTSKTTEQRQRILDNLINNMVYVEGGTFMMGATAEQGNDAFDSEKPVHMVTLSPFFISKYEVTQEEWIAVMGKHMDRQYRQGAKLPEEYVSWDDCQAFIQKLNKLTNMDFRLPTEAEWEFAARGGNKSRGYKYAGSNDPSIVAWSSNNSNGMCQKVGQKMPNELGLYDMSGNVAEWCQDWYGRYNNGTFTNPTGPSDGVERIRRGGHFSFSASYCRITERSSAPQDNRGLSPIGFRLARWVGKAAGNMNKKNSNKPKSHTIDKNKLTSNGIKIVFSSNVPSASLYIDDVLLGKVETYYLKEGSHILKLEAKGYITLKKCIYIEKNNVIYVDMIEEISQDKRKQLLNNLISNMVYVKGGTFMMGATAEQGYDVFNDSKKVHQVSLTSYSIGKYEVTQEEWAAVMGFIPSKEKDLQTPVAGVSWDDCQLFLKELNYLTGKSFRLPTEAEWEYAARGGQNSKGFRYSGSNNINEVGWYHDNSNGETIHIIGQKKPNELGLYDMSGNVWEWCQDWYDNYNEDKQFNPLGPSTGSQRVRRGGSSQEMGGTCTNSYRSSNVQYGTGLCGLRIAL